MNLVEEKNVNFKIIQIILLKYTLDFGSKNGLSTTHNTYLINLRLNS
jgi:hypothetical protein